MSKLAATRDAFTNSTSAGLRVGCTLLLLVTAIVAQQHPSKRAGQQPT